MSVDFSGGAEPGAAACREVASRGGIIPSDEDELEDENDEIVVAVGGRFAASLGDTTGGAEAVISGGLGGVETGSLTGAESFPAASIGECFAVDPTSTDGSVSFAPSWTDSATSSPFPSFPR